MQPERKTYKLVTICEAHIALIVVKLSDSSLLIARVFIQSKEKESALKQNVYIKNKKSLATKSYRGFLKYELFSLFY